MIKEESGISAGTTPTNAVGTGVETSLPPAVEPPGIPRGLKAVKRWQRKKGKKIYESTTYAFKVTISDLGDIVVYAKTETQVRTKLRTYLRNAGQIINIQRIFASELIDFYTTKRAKAMKRIPDVVLEMKESSQVPSPAPLANPQQEKAAQAKNTQSAKQDTQKRMQIAKQNMQKRLLQQKIEMQKNLVNQQKTLQQKAKTGSLNTTPAV
jgi:hypothetical protein